MMFHRPHQKSRWDASKNKEELNINWYKKEAAASNFLYNRIVASEPHRIKLMFEIEKLK